MSASCVDVPSNSIAPVRAREDSSPCGFLTWMRCLIVDIPLMLAFGSFLFLYSIQHIHDTYYTPLIERATRTDEDLMDEFTYYNRQCTAADLTTTTAADLVWDDEIVPDGLEKLMKHGAVVIPEILRPGTVKRLRDYAVYRNEATPEEEVYPMSQGFNRLSYGYDATEHPAVIQAIKEVTQNNQVRELVATVLGDVDPASSEITTITQYYGAIPMGWHSDTKADGNALLFSRTYSHSYSLMISLQNTTQAMGATEVCAGTHYCANDDLTDLCEENSIGLHQSSPEGLFRPGAGFLFNQIVWHRAPPHTDRYASERIIFVVSFLARPRLGKDPRQLSRGTYFHQKWNMWGHTWKDLSDPLVSMKRPFSYLRCWSLWKPEHYSWGYDLITSGFMRFANDQLADGELEEKFVRRLDELGFPTSWRGPSYLENEWGQKEAWVRFLRITLRKTHAAVKEIVFNLHAMYLLLLATIVIIPLFWRRDSSGQYRMLRFGIQRLILGHGFLALLVLWGLRSIRTSQWGNDVLNGEALRRPFPPVRIAREAELSLISKGPTTLPLPYDVLIGSRFDAAWLGAYENWLDGHRGNQVYLKAIRGFAPFFMKVAPIDAFKEYIVQSVIDEIELKRGRLLEQDYRNGDWREMLDVERRKRIVHDLVRFSSPLLHSLQQTLSRATAHYRFGTPRDSAMARETAIQLVKWQERLTQTSISRRVIPLFAIPYQKGNSEIPIPTRTPTLTVKSAGDEFGSLSSTLKFTSTRSTFPPTPILDELQPGIQVLVNIEYLNDGYDDDEWRMGEILEPVSFSRRTKSGRKFLVAIDTGDVIEVHRSNIVRLDPLVEGQEVEGCFEDRLNDCYPGRVLRVMPDGGIAIEYLGEDEEDYDFAKPASTFYRPPQKYLPPSAYNTGEYYE